MSRYLTPAQRSNFLPLTAWGYAWWRERSLTLLSGERFPLSREERLFLTLCQPRAGDHWLDIGTSTGFYAGILARQGCRVDALDLSPAMLREAEKREPSPLVQWRGGNGEDTGIHTTYEGITIGATLNETAHPEKMLREAVRLLKPGGKLWLMYVNSTGGLAQRFLGQVGGLTFPDQSWILNWMPELRLKHSARFGVVEFMLMEK